MKLALSTSVTRTRQAARLFRLRRARKVLSIRQHGFALPDWSSGLETRTRHALVRARLVATDTVGAELGLALYGPFAFRAVCLLRAFSAGAPVGAVLGEGPSAERGANVYGKLLAFAR